MAHVVRAIREDGEWRAEELLPAVYADLRRVARVEIANAAHNQSLAPTELVHEALLRLTDAGRLQWEQRSHFFYAAGRAMRDVLVERARYKATLRRGGAWQRGEIEADDLPSESDALALLALADALDGLRLDTPRQCEILRLRLFERLDEQQAAARLGISVSTVERDWRAIRVQLRRAFGEDVARA